MDIKITPTDHNSEENGVWATYRGVRLLVARANNTNFKNIFRRMSKPHQRDIEKDRLDPDTAEDIMAQSFAVAILLDWDVGTFPGGVEYSKKNAASLLKNDPDCFQFVKETSEDLDNYLVQDQDDTMGES